MSVLTLPRPSCPPLADAASLVHVVATHLESLFQQRQALLAQVLAVEQEVSGPELLGMTFNRLAGAWKVSYQLMISVLCMKQCGKQVAVNYAFLLLAACEG